MSTTKESNDSKGSTNKSKSFPILYKKNDADTIFFWKTIVLNNNEEVYLITEHGVNEGKVKKSKRKVTKAGRATNLFEKGIKTAEKKWKDKISKGGYVDNLSKLDTNTPFISPMLAKKVTIKNNLISGMKFPLNVQPKLDGFRCICKYDTTLKIIELVSRNNLPYKGLQTLKNNLLILYDKLPDNKKNVYLDGELYIPDIPFETLSGLIKRAQNHVDYDIKNIEFRIYDCFEVNDIKINFSNRTTFLKSTILPECDNIKYVQTEVINNIVEFKKYYTLFMEEGYEGIMVRNMLSPYELSKRSSYLQKYKEFNDDEFEIIGFQEGCGVDEKTVIWKCKTTNNEEFNVRPIGDLEHRRLLFSKAPKYIGKMLTVKYQELSEIGVPRFPVGKDIRE